MCLPCLQGKRHFAKVMFKRLAKLGINKTDPDELTSEEVRTRILACKQDTDAAFQQGVTQRGPLTQ
jgi:hypothetical protein